MKFKVKLSRVGMNMEEATITKWHKAPGDEVKASDALYDIETEKVTMEVPAAVSGKLAEILISEGDIAAVGQALCVVETV
jgi:pyruvate/2-oxoglutarate dehydrogenase complex dihydrolipoamide acyltransferase (E2) component